MGELSQDRAHGVVKVSKVIAGWEYFELNEGLVVTVSGQRDSGFWIEKGSTFLRVLSSTGMEQGSEI